MPSQAQVITYLAPAKVILSGEHAVVFGKPALVTTINRRLAFSAWTSNSRKLNSLGLVLKRIVEKYLGDNKIHFQPLNFDFKIKSQIAIGRGLGSSAALACAAAGSLLELYTNKVWPKTIVNNLAYQIEKHFHTTPSGVDNTVVCFGGLIFYRKEFEFLKSTSFLKFTIRPKISKKLILIDSGKPSETTAQMVLKVKQLSQEKDINYLLLALEKTTKEITLALKENNPDRFRLAISQNQRLLEKLGVVSNRTKFLINSLKDYGAGKITGAGGIGQGSGYILFLTDRMAKLVNYLNQNKIGYLEFQPTQSGLVKDA